MATIKVTWTAKYETAVEVPDNTTEQQIRDAIADIDIDVKGSEYVSESFEETNRETGNLVVDQYEDGKCPDCGDKIPHNTDYGEACANCEHVFNEPTENEG